MSFVNQMISILPLKNYKIIYKYQPMNSMSKYFENSYPLLDKVA